MNYAIKILKAEINRILSKKNTKIGMFEGLLNVSKKISDLKNAIEILNEVHDPQGNQPKWPENKGRLGCSVGKV